LPNLTETVKFAHSYSSDESVPFVWRESQDSAFDVLAVTDADPPAWHAGNFHTVATGAA
jgi:hypothetical protein